jgi:hypothetical protein
VLLHPERLVRQRTMLVREDCRSFECAGEEGGLIVIPNGWRKSDLRSPAFQRILAKQREAKIALVALSLLALLCCVFALATGAKLFLL